MKLAYCGVPHFGGTYTVFRSLRAGLASHGIELRWLGTGRPEVLAAPEFAADFAWGENIGGRAGPGGDAALARATASHLAATGYQGVIVNTLACRIQTNLARYLPQGCLRLLIAHGISEATYQASAAIRDHVHATVAVAPRVRTDLIRRFAFDPTRIVTIPNAVELAPYLAAPRAAPPPGPLRILSFGRIDEAAKGVFWLPRIMAALPPGLARLTIAGAGPDLARLQALAAPLADRISFLGRIPLGQEAALYAAHDVFLMPSRLEGFGQTIVEAMAAGCVPVVSRIRGVTDTIIAEGVDGCLFPMGDVAAAATELQALALNRARLQTMAAAARRNVVEPYGLARQAAAYAGLLQRLAAAPPPIARPLPLASWRYPPGLRPSLRSYLPGGLKNLLRVARERLQPA